MNAITGFVPEGFAPLKESERYCCVVCALYKREWFDRCPSCKSFNSMKRVKLLVRELPTVGEDNESPAMVDEHGKIVVSEETDGEESEDVGPRAEQASKIKYSGRKRMKLGVPGLDDMFGGGVVSGQVSLISGDPGVGKSTLLLQGELNLCMRGLRVLHADAEEPKANVLGRCEQLGVKKNHACMKNLFILDDADFFEDVLDEAERVGADAVFLNSIGEYMAHDVHGEPVQGDSGDPLQMKRISYLLYKHAHAKDTMRAWFVVCHVNAEGDMAGIKKVQHRCDAQFMLKKDEDFDSNGLVWMTTEKHKNRFGNSRIKVLYEMVDPGVLKLKEVVQPSKSGGPAAGLPVKKPRRTSSTRLP